MFLVDNIGGDARFSDRKARILTRLRRRPNQEQLQEVAMRRSPSENAIPIGSQFSRLTIIDHTPRDKWGYCRAIVRCSCGSVRDATFASLRGGKLKSCGCGKHSGGFPVVHGETGTKSYRAWKSMRRSCRTQNIPIPEWLDTYIGFVEMVGRCPSDDHRIKTIAGDPSTAKWVRKHKHPDKVIVEYQKRWADEHRASLREYAREYAKTPRQRKQRKAYIKALMRNPEFRMRKNLRCRVRVALRKARLQNPDRYIALLGCSYKQYAEYIESLFVDGMSWDNYGTHGWHIDHIRPCCTFDLTDMDQARACFHYSNTQPLWAADNLSKGGKWRKLTR